MRGQGGDSSSGTGGTGGKGGTGGITGNGGIITLTGTLNVNTANAIAGNHVLGQAGNGGNGGAGGNAGSGATGAGGNGANGGNGGTVTLTQAIANNPAVLPSGGGAFGMGIPNGKGGIDGNFGKVVIMP